MPRSDASTHGVALDHGQPSLNPDAGQRERDPERQIEHWALRDGSAR
jgi:hypothetical protein